MGRIKQLAEQMAEEKGMTFEEFMSDNYDLPEDYEPDFNGTDSEELREQRDYWRTLK